MKEGFGLTSIDASGDQDDRFARFRLISWWDQEILRKAKVLVIGAGALGNEILKNLALLGIGNIYIVDADYIENSNLSRSVLYRERDNHRAKAEVAAIALQDIYPDIKVRWLQCDVIYSLGMGVYTWADVVICGLDNREARLAVNRNCWKTNTPWIDGAIEGLNGIARVFVPPDGVCYECTMSGTDWNIIKAKQGCAGLTRDEMLTGKTPTTPTSSAVIAGIQCQEAVKLLHGLETLKDKAFMFNGLTHDSFIIEYQKRDDCQSHDTFPFIKRLPRSVRTTIIREFLNEIIDELGSKAVIEFARDNSDIVYRFDCTLCHQSEIVFKPKGITSERDALCPDCGTSRIPQIFRQISEDTPFLDMTLSEIGVPSFDILTGRKGMNQVAFLFEEDAPEILGYLNS
jgi:adenylyltransferase/sulfurtransferase